MIRIAKMTVQDINDAADLEKQVFSQPWSRQGFCDALEQKQNIFLSARAMDGTFLAYCGLYAAGEEGEITNVAVNPSMRRKGIGEQLLQELFVQAKDQGITQIFLEVRHSNLAAQKLYLKMGFQSCGIRKGFYQKPKEDAVVMSVSLEKL